MQKIVKLTEGLPVTDLHRALLANPQLWDQHTARTTHPDSPHHGLSDIWVRFAGPGVDGSQPHRSEWYAPADVLPVRELVYPLMAMMEGDELGGVLITKIPAGMTCKPHTDPGWHARHYDKFAIQVAAEPEQQFCFDGESLSTAPGDLFWFDNSHRHWVTNPTHEDRITLIACLRTESMNWAKA